MNNVLVYCELEGMQPHPASQEILSEGRRLANALGVKLEAVAVGDALKGKAEKNILPYGVDRLCVVESEMFRTYLEESYAEVMGNVLAERQPQIVLFPATFQGYDLAPRLAARLNTGLTAHCTRFEIADYTDPATGKTYQNILHQIRPALGGNLEATIVTPEARPQMATVLQGSFVAEVIDPNYQGEVVYHTGHNISPRVQERIAHITPMEQEQTNEMLSAEVVICGGYGVGSAKNFQLLHELAKVMGGKVAATRPAVDAGWADRSVQIGQTGHTIRPRLFIACGCSGALQFTSGMKDCDTIVSINTDPEAPMNALADYVVIGRVEDVVPRMIKLYQEKK